jgi:carboxypeptidase family protein
VLLLVLIAPPLAAQGSITGTVFDSLTTRAPLAGAEVYVSGVDRSARSDARGRFRLDSVPAGPRTIAFFHPLLDSLAVSAASGRVDVPATGAVSVRLATPSAATVYRALCTAQPADSVNGVVVGTVRDVDDRSAAPGAAVEARWSVLTFGGGAAARSEMRATTRTDDEGRFRLCGVPAGIPLLLHATAGARASGHVELEMPDRPVAFREITVSHRDSAAASGELAGTITRADGSAVEGALVGLIGTGRSATTEATGAFRLTAIPTGTQTIEIRAIGYAPVRRSLEVRTGTVRLDVELDRARVALAPVRVIGKADRTRLDATGFERRRQGKLGRYLDAEEISKHVAYDFTDVLLGTPGIQVIWAFDQPVIVMRGGFESFGNTTGVCRPAFYIDRMRIPDDQLHPESLIRPNDVAGIEVYVGLASIPPEFRGGKNCGAILIWSKKD